MRKILFLILLFILIIFAFSGCTFQYQGIAENLLLKVSKDKILFNEQIDDVRCSIKNKEEVCENLGKIISYLYISDKKVLQENFNGLKEDISKRTNNSMFYEIEDGKWVGKFYSGVPFYKDKSEWYQTETATTTIEAFEEQMKLTLVDRIKGFFVKKAYADTYYSGLGDGHVYYSGTTSNWNTAHNDDGTNATASYTDTTAIAGAVVSPGYRPYRLFLPINTSTIGDADIITSANLYIYITAKADNDNDGYDYVNIVQTSQALVNVLAKEDYDTCGNTHSPTVGSTNIDIGVIGTSAYNDFSLNSTALGWIDKTGTTLLGIREGHDLEDHAIVAENSITISSSNETGTAQDPYLVVYFNNENSMKIKNGTIQIKNGTIQIK